jgi:transcription-repair coupling factor (superfamily II helicase)
VFSLLIPPALLQFLRHPKGTLRIVKAGLVGQAYMAHRLLEAGHFPVVVVPPGIDVGAYGAVLQVLAGEEPLLPTWQRRWQILPRYAPEIPRPALWGERWSVLLSLVRRQSRGIVLPLDNLIHKWPLPSAVSLLHMELVRGEETSMEALVETLVLWGYRRVSMVAVVGEFAVRGDILDIFCPGWDVPLRLETFGDTVERLCLFEPLSQRSRAELHQAVVVPVCSVPQSSAARAAAQETWDTWTQVGELSRSTRSALEQAWEEASLPVPSLVGGALGGLEAWLPAHAVVLVVDAHQLRPKLEESLWEWGHFLRTWQEGLPRTGLLATEQEARRVLESRPCLLFEDLVMGVREQGIELPEGPIRQFADLFWKPEQRQRPWRAVVEALIQWRQQEERVVVAFPSSASRRKFVHMAEEEGLAFAAAVGDGPGLSAVIAPVRHGAYLPWAGLRLLPHAVLHPGDSAPARRRPKAFQGLASFEGLSPGDLLVHRDYGICQYGGLSRVQMGEVANDFLLLRFADDAKLYLPVDRLSCVQRYQGPDGAHPALDRLGGSSWAKARERVRKAVATVARDLVEMYAFRKIAKGFSYGPLPAFYRDFEASFGFDETPDQQRAIAEVLADMERPEPMDRLVCGDVGFGKTEVALRAAFRAVADGKQVALLCPTTVLAEQHYQTFRQRMEPFSVRVALLSRFVPPATQKTVLQAVRDGQVDVLIGTHRMLSKDVEFANLALLILDEEQRFGVQHKERLKKMRATVDVLTLTATPIPRTLQLSLAGVRGLSVIETPPVDRKPVETSIVERSPELLGRIVGRELQRGGQVFWVSNRVQGLEETAAFVRSLAPEARVGMAHGQMPARELETTMHRFWHGELDILVCTAIIESGLDFPRANTLIVDQAHLFGLGQLYQLRGRVGRSATQAYAYFVVSHLDGLPEGARKRLQIILELDYLGAGFRVAMEDLRLRGAGNLLGEAQSGHMGKVGIDLYLEMLEEEVRRLQGGAVETFIEPELHLGFQAVIPEDYIPEGTERLSYYKSLSSCADEASLEMVLDEMRDRFGTLPQQIRLFVGALLVKRAVQRLGAVRVDLSLERCLVHWDATRACVDPQALVAWMRHHPEVRLVPPAKLEFALAGEAPVDRLRMAYLLLEDVRFHACPATRGLGLDDVAPDR